MKRKIKLSEGTQTLVNAILDLERLTGEVYSYIRDEYVKDDSPDDRTGEEILDASSNLRDAIDHYLRDLFNFEMCLTANQNGEEVVI